MPNKKAIVLNSGGLDSATTLALASSQGYCCYALTFDYQQRHRAEIDAAKQLADFFSVEAHRIVHLDLGHQGSALLDKSQTIADFNPDSEAIPNTYVPARNTLFLAYALSFAEIMQADHIFTGICSVDYSNYPDCRPEYLAAMGRLGALATKTGVEGNPVQFHAPLLYLSKAETIRLGLSLGVDYSLSVSCYQANEAGLACGQCDSCGFRAAGFAEAGVNDPTRYQLET